VLYGIDESFWPETVERPPALEAGQVILNEPLAQTLNVKTGDTVVVRLATPSTIPADSPLARKRDRLRSLGQLTVAAVIPAEGLGRFTLSPTHHVSRIAYVPRQLLQSSIAEGNRVNAFLIRSSADSQHQTQIEDLNAGLRLTLEDYGLRLDHIRRDAAGIMISEDMISEDVPTKTPLAIDFWQVTSDRMILDPSVELAIQRAWSDQEAQPSLTYLATSIARVDPPPDLKHDASLSHPVVRSRTAVPYSTITAIDANPHTGPLRLADGTSWPQLQDDEILLNRWTARELGADLATQVRIDYFAPETTHGQPEERSMTFHVVGIVEVTEPIQPYPASRTTSVPGAAVFAEPPTPANDPWLTPIVQGITDQDSIDDWDPPFPFDHRRIKPVDDDYWKNHRTTPKAFVSLAAGRQMWNSRFGNTTAYRIAGRPDLDRQKLTRDLLARLDQVKTELGFAFRDLRAESELAARGTTPFDVLFLLFSIFIIVAALILLVLLLRLSIEQRAGQIGLWKACGASTTVVRQALLRESLVTLVVGSLLGVLLGIAYAAGIVLALRTWWLAAIVTSFVVLRVHPLPVLLGGMAGGVIAWLTMTISIRSLAALPPIRLLRGSINSAQRTTQRIRTTWIPVFLLLAAFGVGWYGMGQTNESQAGCFLGSGALLLGSLLWGLYAWLSHDRRYRHRAFGLPQLAFSATGSDPTRTTLTVALTAWASFLVVAVSLFRIAPTDHGTGGFALWGITDQPIFSDLNDPVQANDINPSLAQALEGTKIFSLRLHQGEDASCRNLYRTSRPRIVGVPDAFIQRYSIDAGAKNSEQLLTPFTWSGTSEANPWERLRAMTSPPHGPLSTEVNDAIPVVLDQNTAMYALQLYGGVGQEFAIDYGDNRTVRFRVAGLLTNSFLQGSLVVSEQDLLRHFPETAGHQYFLIDCPLERRDAIAQQLERNLSDEGMSIRSTKETLAELLAVQNTYLSSFQTLGGLGLGLGTLRLAAVQLRSVLRRQGELALLAAVGYTRRRIRSMVLFESLSLLVLGLGAGSVAAVGAVLPHARFTGTSFPVGTLAILLSVVLAFGAGASWFATRGILSARLLDSLRAP
ncbi:MAG: ABC transporter permease, partial [Planctomycetota bacterium]|nr:ABC transporter permease [Planctomycetota bacterium]